MDFTKLNNFLEKQVNIAPLVTFRFIFGAMMVFSTIRFMYLGWIYDHYILPKFHFKYFGFEWVENLSPDLIYGVHIVMLIAAIGIMLGAFYRIASVLFFLTFTYTELIDLTYYLNHYYFVSLTAMVLMFLPANRSFSIDVWLNPKIRVKTIPNYILILVKFQIAVVYFYAGLAKINPTWLLEAMPLKIWLPANDTLPILGGFLKLPIAAYLFSWAGMIFDTTIIFFLAYRPTRIFAYAAILFFHTVTGLMFQIGIFPLVMMACTLTFFSDEWHERLQKFLSIGQGKNDMSQNIALKRRISPLLGSVIGAFILFQIVFPWRFLLYEGSMFWTEQGYRFGWRVMLMEKAGTATFYVKDGKTGREGVVINDEFLNPHQEKQMAMQPDMILQYAHFLKQYYEKQGLSVPTVRAEVYVTLNGKPSQLYFDPNMDLTQIKDSWKSKTWLNDFNN